MKSDTALSSAGRELKENPPKVLASTRRKFGAKRADKQRKAIMFSKARKLGATVPRPKNLGR